MNVLVILNDPPYGTERSYNGLRLAGSLAKREGHDVRVFLMRDASSCAKAGQAVPQGWHNLNRMLTVVIQNRGAVGVCGSCMDARGLKGRAGSGHAAQFARGAHRLDAVSGPGPGVLRERDL